MKDVSALAQQLVEASRDFYARGWALGTSGNFSAVVSHAPLRLAITTSGRDKGTLAADQIVEIDERARAVRGPGQPSAEAVLHVAIVNARGQAAGSVLHTHSIWSTILSEQTADGGLAVEGYEMLKGLSGIETHEHREWLPILENSQDWPSAVPLVSSMLGLHPDAHGFLIRGHGLYTWGRDVAEARRHVEILEFLLEVMGRKRGVAWQA